MRVKNQWNSVLWIFNAKHRFYVFGHEMQFYCCVYLTADIFGRNAKGRIANGFNFVNKVIGYFSNTFQLPPLYIRSNS